ncbi:glycosyltransferase family 4 protein [Actinokineospora xionganensis]|uniref:Glycosyltransferase family 4 protein n=1 Tax=Actinokineospora xionganensis TaxID=2684470 RepID=A0ABR7L3N7_9PSEU|nr:glycosyltransferase family 4 protein [Actinokineospora xionganensis]MBC6447279.1 glycosyltransferase family 4 protein [Actinokineospora xionganensis]
MTDALKPLRGARVVVVNWRDRGHGLAGGAEEYAVRVAEAMARAGASVTFLTARDEGQSAGERSDTLTTVRRGGQWTVYLWALLWLLRNRRRVDVVVDCQNGIPFFSPLVLARRTRVVLLMHHVHDAQFAVHFPPWLAAVGRWLEGPAARRVYRGAVTVAVSPSTVHAMRARLGWTGPVYVVPNGMDQAPKSRVERAPEPTLVCLGRLVTHKRVDRLIRTVEALADRWPTLRLHIVGGGPEEPALRALAARLDGAVEVHGYVDSGTKSALLGRSWLNVTLSDGEGWGLAVVEAAAHGVPTLCRDVDGLRDSVRHGDTGWLIPGGADLAEAIDRVLTDLADPARAEAVAKACQDWATRFDWAATGERFTALVAALRAGLKVGEWQPGMPEAIIAEFPADAEPHQPTSVGTRSGTAGISQWELVEQCHGGDLLAELERAGRAGVTVRAAADAERLLGGSLRNPREGAT